MQNGVDADGFNGEQFAEVAVEKILSPQWKDFDPNNRIDGRLEGEKRFGSWRVGLGTDAGQNPGKQENQDVVAAKQLRIPDQHIEDTLLILADGMGGHSNGKEAAQLTTDVIQEQYPQLRRTLSRNDALRASVTLANAAVLEQNRNTHADSGTTLAVFAAGNDGAFTALHIGDARTYQIRPNRAEQLGNDHSFAQSEIVAGRLQPVDVYTFSGNNFIFRSVGVENFNLDDSIVEGKVQKGEQLLACSDGLWEMTKDPDGSIIHKIARSAQEQSEVARRLLAKANEEGGIDNVGVVIAKYDGPQQVQSVQQDEIASTEAIVPSSEISGLKINVIRGNGTVEAGWNIDSVAPKGRAILVSKDGLLKSVPFEDFLRANNERTMKVPRSDGTIDPGWKITGLDPETSTFIMSKRYGDEIFIKNVSIHELLETN